MRTALISDIHGNADALHQVLSDIAAQNCDRILCLGDLVEGGEQNEAVVACLQQQGIACVQGNHDAINDAGLKPETQDFLDQLPIEIIEGQICFTHISPRRMKRKIQTIYEAWNVFEECHYHRLFIGHLHFPVIFGQKSEDFACATLWPFVYNQPFELNPEDRYIMCVGSVGYGRDRLGKIRYGIYDNARQTIEMRALTGPLLAMDWSLR